jgi:hypothetical protein
VRLGFSLSGQQIQSQKWKSHGIENDDQRELKAPTKTRIENINYLEFTMKIKFDEQLNSKRAKSRNPT